MAEVAIGTAPPQVRVSLRRLLDERQVGDAPDRAPRPHPRRHHRAAAVDAALEELPGRERRLRRPAQLRHLLLDPDAVRLAPQQRRRRGAVDRDRRAARLHLCLRPDPKLHAGEGPVLRRGAAADLRAVAAVGAVADLHLRQPGLPAPASDRRLDLRPDRHRHRRGAVLFPARALDPRDRARARRRAPLRGGGGARHRRRPASSGPSPCRARATASSAPASWSSPSSSPISASRR